MRYRTENVPETAEPAWGVLQYLEKAFIIETQIKPKIYLIKQELEKISDSDPKIIEEGEKLHKLLSRIDWRDLHRPFTI